MELNNINNKGAWSEIAAALNQNFLKILAELLKYQHVTTISGANFLGYFTSSSVLPNPAEAAWAVAGDLKAVTVYAYYTSDAVPSGSSAGWNALSSLGTYDFTNYSELLNKVSELEVKINNLEENPNVEIVDNLTDGSSDKALSAKMGKVLNMDINGGSLSEKIPFVTGRYINQYGQETANGNPVYARTEPIYLKSGVVLNFGKYNFITVGYRTGTSGGYSVKKYESSITVTLNDSYTTESDGYYIISSYTSAFEAYPPSSTKTVEGLRQEVELLLGNKDVLNELPELINDVKGGDFLIFPTIVKGSYVSTYGQTSTPNNGIYARTEPYWIEKGTKVVMKTNNDDYCAIGYRTGTSGGYSIVTKGEDSDELKEYTWIATIDCYVVFSSLTSVFEQYQPRIYKVEAVSLTEIRETLNEVYRKSIVEALPITAPTREKVILGEGKKVILYGDSISYTSHNDRYKTLMEDYTHSEVYAAGYDGASTAMLASDEVLERIWNYDPDLIIIEVGGNDTGQSGTVGTFGAIDNGEPLVEETDINVDYSGTYFIQAVSHILRKVKAHYYNIIERAGVTLPTTSNEDRAKIEAVKKPIIAIWTTLPQKRLAGYYSNPDCWLRKRNAIVECCNKYDVLCIDIWAYNGIDWDLEPIYNGEYWQRLNGIYTHDGVHPNPWGYEKICKVIAGALL